MVGGCAGLGQQRYEGGRLSFSAQFEGSCEVLRDIGLIPGSAVGSPRVIAPQDAATCASGYVQALPMDILECCVGWAAGVRAHIVIYETLSGLVFADTSILTDYQEGD